MAKKKKAGKTSIDYDIGISGIIPATQEAFSGNDHSLTKRKEEKASVEQFKNTLSGQIQTELSKNTSFPTEKEVFIFIVQYFVAENEYSRRDIDNMAKTVLDVLKGTVYKDDHQVKTLLVGKKIDRQVPQNFTYIAVKLLNSSQEVDAMKISGLERSVTIFNELKKRGVI